MMVTHLTDPAMTYQIHEVPSRVAVTERTVPYRELERRYKHDQLKLTREENSLIAASVGGTSLTVDGSVHTLDDTVPYSAIRVHERGTLNIPSGTYYIHDFEIGRYPAHQGHGRVNFTISNDEPVIIYTNRMSIVNSPEVTLQGGDASDVVIYVQDSASFGFSGAISFFGTLVAPNATVFLSSGSVWQGQIIANRISVPPMLTGEFEYVAFGEPIPHCPTNLRFHESLTWCDTSPCSTNAMPVVKLCPDDQPDCTPSRSTTVVPTICDRPVGDLLLYVDREQGYSLHLVSGEVLIWSHLRYHDAPGIVIQSDIDVEFTLSRVRPNWGGVTVLDYRAVSFPDERKDVAVFWHESTSFDDIVEDMTEPLPEYWRRRALEIVDDQIAISGLEPPHGWLNIMPNGLASTFGSGNHSSFDGMDTVNWGHPSHLSHVGPDRVLGEVAHEYAHQIFRLIQTQIGSNSGCLNEGMADAFAYYLGLIDDDNFYPDEEDCTQLSEPHDLGNCYLWHVHDAGLLNEDFLNGLFHPQHTFQFNSCDPSSVDTGNSLLVYFTEAAGQDMIDVIGEMSLSSAGSYEEALDALGF
jgi:hypothetical protein